MTCSLVAIHLLSLSGEGMTSCSHGTRIHPEKTVIFAKQFGMKLSAKKDTKSEI